MLFCQEFEYYKLRSIKRLIVSKNLGSIEFAQNKFLMVYLN